MSNRIRGIIDAVADIAAQPGDGLLDKIKAYHGSPHDFDRFSSDNIGTGEGAQAYGHGLYFAEREPTAMSYRDSLTPRDVDYEEYLMDQYRIAESGQDYSRMDMLERAMQHDTPRDFRDIAADADYDDDYRQLAADMADEMEGFVSSAGTPVNFGHMYEVDIDARPEELLDFDAPLSEQSDKVKKVWEQWRASAAGKRLANEMPGNFEGDITGQEMHGLIYEGMTPDPQQQYGRGVAVKESIDASQFLKEQGIKGIKYADAQTRFSPKGKTSNYVIFDDQLIDIAKKYGVSLPVAAAMFGSEETEAGPLTAGRRLIDPGFSVALGGGKPRVGLIDAIEQMPAGITPRAMDKGGEYDLYDFEGSPYILTQSDRSSAGGILESLYGTEIDPVDLRGGRDFMFDSPSEGMVWASDPKVTKGLFERAQRLEQDYGKPPLLLPYTMAPTGIDFATMPLDTMINFARASMAKKDIKALDKDIKKIIPEWKGVADPTANEIFRTVGGDPRKAVADLIDKKYRNVEGGLSIAEARAATTDASQYTGEMGDLANIGVFDTKRGLIADSGHPTYIGGIPGEGVGTLRDTINARELALDKGRVMKGDSSDIRSLSMNHELQQGVLDENLLRRLYDNKDKVAVAGAGVAGPSLANASSAQSGDDGAGLLGAIGDVALEAMSGVNRAAIDGVNFLTTDQINALLNLSGSDRRVPDLYDVPGVRSGTVGNTMEPGLLRQIVRQGSEFISPI